ncbi:myosin heavy chain, partial [Trypanosoma theileri]
MGAMDALNAATPENADLVDMLENFMETSAAAQAAEKDALEALRKREEELEELRRRGAEESNEHSRVLDNHKQENEKLLEELAQKDAEIDKLGEDLAQKNVENVRLSAENENLAGDLAQKE